jgi:predicted transcriptional regulator
MKEEFHSQSVDIVELAGDIVSAYVSNNSVPVSELPTLLGSVHATLASLASGARIAAAEPAVEVEKPSAAQIRKSITEEGIVSFLDGKTYKTLKRHLTTYGLEPRSYRDRYGLPADYPMVAPAYAAQRSALAKQIGLGRPGAQAERQTERQGSRREAA